jgi:hypothetical protein
MGKPAYLVGNQITLSTPITVSTEDTDFTKVNSYDTIMAKPFRWTVSTGGTYEVDRGATAGSYDTILIAGHNFNSAATFSIKAGAAPAPAGVIDTPVWAEKYIVALFATPRTERYIHIAVTDSQTDATVKSEMGEVIIGLRTALSISFRPGHIPGKRGADIVQETLGQLWHWNKQKQRRVLQLVFRIHNLTMRDEFEAWYDATVGRQKPQIWIPDVSVEEAFYVRRMVHSWEPQELTEAIHAYDEQVTLVEESEGITIP